MKSIKGGREPSIVGAIAAFGVALVGIVFTTTAVSMINRSSFGNDSGAATLFTVFGVVFVLIAVSIGIHELHNATAENRPSIIDITDGDEEPDPLNEYFHGKYEVESTESPAAKGGMYCPYCGKPIQADFAFCSHCGKELKK